MYILFFLLFLLFLLKVPEGFKIWNKSGMDYPGNDLENGTYSLMACKKNCIKNASCQGIVTDYQGDGPGNCWLKSDLTQGVSASNRWAYLLSRA
jgi:hypothetical protein